MAWYTVEVLWLFALLSFVFYLWLLWASRKDRITKINDVKDILDKSILKTNSKLIQDVKNLVMKVGNYKSELSNEDRKQSRIDMEIAHIRSAFPNLNRASSLLVYNNFVAKREMPTEAL
jgi:seryl-tRNA synthetase